VERYVYRSTEGGKEKDGKRVTKIVMTRADGSSFETKIPDVDAIRASVPEVRNGKCADTTDGKPVVEKFERDGKKVMIICSNRIEKITVEAQKVAIDARRMGMQSAMMGLRMARRSIEGQFDLSTEQRANALKGIDEAIAEVEKSVPDDK
jgi:bla regulator protein blaR1